MARGRDDAPPDGKPAARDDRAARKALARIRKARAAVDRAIADAEDPDAAQAARAALTDWEDEFMSSVEARLTRFGSAFADPAKGAPGEALSHLQLVKLKEIEAKARGKPRKGFNRRSSFRPKAPASRARARDIHEDMPEAAPAPEATVRDEAPGLSPARAARPALRIIRGGRDDSNDA
ncbi:hypothetical protein [Alkalicaulis satelles]|uniref:hypothetical protein n=1 Tax=Alkalicaulis satelles TaxID=2609175 RepID=UPI0018EA3ABE|nr:hypothetical protein [Alkalicaulis satelles]